MPNQEGVFIGTCMAVQRLRLCASTAGGTGSIPGWGTKSLHALLQGREKKKKKKRPRKKKKERGVFVVPQRSSWLWMADGPGLILQGSCSWIPAPILIQASIWAHLGLLTGPPAPALSWEDLLIAATCQPTQSPLSLKPLLTRDISTYF